ALALERQLAGKADAEAREQAGILGNIGAFEKQHCQALAARQRVAMERAEMSSEADVFGIALQQFRLGDGQQFDVEAIELDQVVVCAPRMAVARADREAELAIEL